MQILLNKILLNMNIMNIWDPVFAPFKTMFLDGADALKALSVIVATCMAVGYKVMEMVAGPQEDQMYAQKTKKVLIALLFIFIIPTIAQVVQQAF